MELPYGPTIQLLGICPKEKKAGTQTGNLFMHAYNVSLVIAKRWKHPECPSMNKWINKAWYIHTMEYYLALKRKAIQTHVTTWINPEDIMLSETGLSRKDTNMHDPISLRYLTQSYSRKQSEMAVT